MRNINDTQSYTGDDGNEKNMTTFDHSGKFLDDKTKPLGLVTIKEKEIIDEYEKEIRLLVDESIDNQQLKDEMDLLTYSTCGGSRYNPKSDITYEQVRIKSWMEPIERSLYKKAIKNLLKKYGLLSSNLLK